MNVLILTPDAVGSTLLQRLLTIYMQFHEFDRPVINIHELTNGIIQYHSPEFNRTILGEHSDYWREYYQTLEQIVTLLQDVDHYTVARLAQYHIRRREDTIEDQLPFYQYLNDNFFIISCRRQNVFEHAISQTINKITKKLNVYSLSEKIDAFFDIYQEKINLDPISFIHSLDRYKRYINWCDDHFTVSSYFDYDTHLSEIENYILNLPIFSGQQKKISWQDVYGVNFNDWNRCHKYLHNVQGVVSNQDSKLLGFQSSEKNVLSKSEITTGAIIDNCTEEEQILVKANFNQYLAAKKSIEQMGSLGIIPGGKGIGIPIKKQTFNEKIQIIKNLDQILEVYHQWIANNSEFKSKFDVMSLENLTALENNFWNPGSSDLDTKSTDQISDRPPND
jgi:hypothetical protein